MTIFSFFLGLLLGLGIYASQQYRFNQQLKKTLRSYVGNKNEDVSLPLQSLIRLELTELNRQRQQLEQDKQAWQELIEQAPIGYLQVDADNQLLGCNQTAKDLLHIDSQRSLRVRLLLELVRSYDLDQLIELTRNSQRSQTKEWIFYFTRYVSPQQPELPTNSAQPLQKIVESIALKGSGFPLPKQQVGVFIENRQPLLELSQSRDRTFADLTHELRTPLTSISLVAENLLRRLQDPERRWVEQMRQETNRLIELVQEWLDLTQLQATPNQALKYETFRLDDLVESVWQTLEPIAKRKEVTLAYNGDRQMSICADRSRLIQVFLNLLDNAIKHNSIGKQILIQVSESSTQPNLKNQIKIDIIDSGTGFNNSDIPFIFERLYRGDKSRTREPSNSTDGSGLGLAIVEQIVRAHGGTISAKNHPLRGGAWVEILLPTDKAKNS
ncbi:cell wall metabolism sensor histidine kinase WalK [Pleurocapsa sp. CCALA 161]|uniref:sensor histidine kinase n=1 Tax=Pleurocapsa sp. CCALA 161 TaxID=2107688 RepID=UPI0018ECD319|nr:HAMP domain-containing sensor histidine kinase [Pleurocapsa sp. CCALA 161]